MTNALLFNFCNGIAMLGWFFLMALPKWKFTGRIIMGVGIMLLALIYSYIVVTTFDASAMESFSRLDGVMALFTNETAVLAGWIHYLTFDLMVGLFIVNNARKSNVPHLYCIPALLGTFMFGPAGLLIYLLIRWIKTKQYFLNYPEIKQPNS